MPFLRPKPRRKAFSLSTPSLMSVYGVPPGKFLVGGDLSQLEARVVAVLANDLPMLDCFARGDDLHRLNALGLFGKTEEEWILIPDNEQLRDMAKTFLYGGLMYGGSPDTIHSQIVRKKPDFTLNAVKSAISTWQKAHPAIGHWQELQIAKGKKDGYVEIPILGTRSHFYGRVEPTICLNFPVQGFGAYIMKKIIRRVADRIDWVRTAIVMQVHDALYLETDDPVGTWFLLKEEMTKSVVLEGRTLILAADVGIGTRWGNVKKCKTKEAALVAAEHFRALDTA